jgi:hypothetical protein
MIGVGEEQNIEKIIKNYLKLLFQKLLNTRVHIFLIFPLHAELCEVPFSGGEG